MNHCIEKPQYFSIEQEMQVSFDAYLQWCGIFSPPPFKRQKVFSNESESERKSITSQPQKLAIMPAAHANGPLREFSSAQLSSLIRPPIFPLDPRSDGGGGKGGEGEEWVRPHQKPIAESNPPPHSPHHLHFLSLLGTAQVQ